MDKINEATMNANDASTMSLADIKRADGQLTNSLAYSGEHHLRKAKRAGITRKHWTQTGCDKLMTFVDFRQQGRRNKIRRSYGLDAIYLPHESKPNTIH